MAAFKEAATTATLEFTDYVKKLVEKRRGREGDDLLSRLMAAEEEGTRLSENELVAMTFEMILAGHETTSNAISNGIWLLLRHPDQLTRLRKEPEAIPGAVEEMLRYESPAPMAMSRVATRDVDLGGTVIPEGESALVLLVAANRDPAVFDDPDRFLVDRAGAEAHLSFGGGIHFCLGRRVGLQSGMMALSSLLRRFPDLRVAARPEWRKTIPTRRLDRLDVTVGPGLQRGALSPTRW